MTTRRDFLRTSAFLTAGLAAMPYIGNAQGKKIAPSDKIKIGLIGCKGMGWADLSAFLNNPECECIALCDIDDEVLSGRAADVEKKSGKKPQYLYKDWRKLVDNKEVDLVIVGTPDHWHCLQMVAACQAGKAVYCEKPLGNSIEECNIMMKAADKYNTVVQVGQWQRSDPHWQDAVNFVHSGQLGTVRTIRVFSYQGWCGSIPVVANEPCPKGVDYDMWLGPATKRDFNRNRFHFTFRWFWDYAGGLMTDWGVHLLDYALYGMQVETPKSIMASGGKYGYPTDACETPDTMQAIYEFDNFTVLWDQAIGINDGAYNRNHGIAFVGENGTLVLNREGWEVIPEHVNGKNRMEAVPLKRQYGAGGLELHVKNHLACMKANNRNTNASTKIGADIAKFSQLGNIAYRSQKKLVWNGSLFVNDNEANTYIAPVYHNNWKLPQV